MKIERFGNIVLPWIDSWIYGYRHVTSAIYKNKPIPSNVTYLAHCLEEKKQNTSDFSIGEEWSVLYENSKFGLVHPEDWVDYLRYDGASRWTMRTINLLGDEKITQRYGTKALIEWALEREAQEYENNNDPDEEFDSEERLGVVLSKLLEIAERANANYCIQCIERIKRGEPLVKPKLINLQVTKIKGVTIKGIWIRVYSAFFVAETPEGEAYLWFPMNWA